jgi:CBS domain containing-hemolysin-like protein
MTEQTIILLAIFPVLVLDLIAIAMRTAFLETSYTRLLTMRDEDEQSANRVLPIIQIMPRVRASLNLILVILRFGLSGLVLAFAYTWVVANQWIALAILVLSALLLFWIEWLVERYVMRSPEEWAVRFVPSVRVLIGLMALPVALPMSLSGDSKGGGEITVSVTEEEFKTLVDAGQEEGFVDEGEHRMIQSIFRLGDTLTREIMVPRIDMLALDVGTSLPKAVDAFVNSGYSRVPVYEETVDNTLGMLYAKDLLRVLREGEEIGSLTDLLRSVYFVPEAKKVDELLDEMQSQRRHIAIVVDEYGGVAGLVTLEDIVEEIFGEIQDEYDQAEEAPYQELEDGDYIFLGRVDLDDFNDIFGSDLPGDEADTLGGFIYSRLGRVPEVGEQVENDNLLLTVEQVSARRIRKVRASWIPHNAKNKDENQHANG